MRQGQGDEMAAVWTRGAASAYVSGLLLETHSG